MGRNQRPVRFDLCEGKSAAGVPASGGWAMPGIVAAGAHESQARLTRPRPSPPGIDRPSRSNAPSRPNWPPRFRQSSPRAPTRGKLVFTVTYATLTRPPSASIGAALRPDLAPGGRCHGSLPRFVGGNSRAAAICCHIASPHQCSYHRQQAVVSAAFRSPRCWAATRRRSCPPRRRLREVSSEGRDYRNL